MDPIQDPSIPVIVDIMKIVARPDRLRLILALESGPHLVADLTLIIHGTDTHAHRSQTSSALAPIRRLKLVQSFHHGQYVSYRLTRLGHKVLNLVKGIRQETYKASINGK